LSRDGPGLLIRDVLDAEDAQVAATVEVLRRADADIVLLLDLDYDGGSAALTQLVARLSEVGVSYAHTFSARPNTGWPTGVDIDGDGRSHRRRDSHGYGAFSGQGGMALLSRYPIAVTQDFSQILWRDLPESRAANVLSPAAFDVLRLASVAAWDIAFDLPSGAFHVLALHATPPVFDGPEDRNGLRNADELLFWVRYLDGWSPGGAPFVAEHFAVMGTFNVDPDGGEGRQDGLTRLLSHPRLQDAAPRGGGGTATADWEDPVPGDLRVDYILPAAPLRITDSGVMWDDDDPVYSAASDHRLVWVDIAF